MFKDIIAKLKGGAFLDAQRKAASTVFAIHKPRIFQKGLDPDGAPIGVYRPNSKDKRGDKRGGQTVILTFAGSMKKDYQPTKDGSVGYGFSNQDEVDKANFCEERYGEIFALSEAEAKLYMDTLTDEIFGKK
jgi:hypothetical protein